MSKFIEFGLLIALLIFLHNCFLQRADIYTLTLIGNVVWAFRMHKRSTILSKNPASLTLTKTNQPLGRRTWKRIGRATAITAFVLFLPLSSSIFTSCEYYQVKRGEKILNDIAHSLFVAKQYYTDDLNRLAKAMSCTEFSTQYGATRDPETFQVAYYGSTLWIVKFIRGWPNWADCKIINDYQLVPKVVENRKVLEYDGRLFGADDFNCIVTAIKNQNLNYNLLIRDGYFSALCFELPQNVVVYMLDKYTPKEVRSRWDSQVQKEGSDAGETIKKIGKTALTVVEAGGMLVVGTVVGTACYVVPGLLAAPGIAFNVLALGLTGPVVEVTSHTLTKKVELFKKIHKWRRKPNDQLLAVASLFMDEKTYPVKDAVHGLHPVCFVQGGTLPLGYTKDWIYISLVAGLYGGLTPAILFEDFLIKNNDLIGRVDYAHTTERVIYWYRLKDFERVKKTLQENGIDYILSVGFDNRLAFLINTEPLVGVYLDPQ